MSKFITKTVNENNLSRPFLQKRLKILALRPGEISKKRQLIKKDILWEFLKTVPTFDLKKALADLKKSRAIDG